MPRCGVYGSQVVDLRIQRRILQHNGISDITQHIFHAGKTIAHRLVIDTDDAAILAAREHRADQMCSEKARTAEDDCCSGGHALKRPLSHAKGVPYRPADRGRHIGPYFRDTTARPHPDARPVAAGAPTPTREALKNRSRSDNH